MGDISIQVEELVELEGLNVGLIMVPPKPAELFHDLVDFAVVSDYVGFSSFSRLLDSNSENAEDFLTTQWLDEIRDRFGGKARDPTALLALGAKERFRGHAIQAQTSLVHLGTVDRRYVRKFIMFVPTLIDEPELIVEAKGIDYAEAALCVAGFTRSRLIYFGGFGRPDGSFEDETIVRMVARVHGIRRLLNLPPMRVYFKYFELASGTKIDRLADRVCELGRAEPAGEIESPDVTGGYCQVNG